MNSEIQILKKIWEDEEESHIKSISSQTGFGLDYVRYVCNCLIREEKIAAVKKNRDLYRITSKGKKELILYGIIKSKILPLTRKIKKIKSNLIKPEEKINLGRGFTKTIFFLKRQLKDNKKILCQQEKKQKK